jgi:hypothetical protein
MLCKMTNGGFVKQSFPIFAALPLHAIRCGSSYSVLHYQVTDSTGATCRALPTSCPTVVDLIALLENKNKISQSLGMLEQTTYFSTTLVGFIIELN